MDCLQLKLLILFLSFICGAYCEEQLKPGKPLDESDFQRGQYVPGDDEIPEDWAETEAHHDQIVAESANSSESNRFGMYPVINTWPNGIVPYELSALLGPQARGSIGSVIKEINENSCIKLVPRTTETDYIFINTDSENDGGCWSALGYQGGRQLMHLDQPKPGKQGHCIWGKTIRHEFFHAFGVIHEHQRPDRDDYVTINWSNIKKGSAPNMVKAHDADSGSNPPPRCPRNPPEGADLSNCYSGVSVKTYGIPYDYTSIMHYSTISFAINKDIKTINPKNFNGNFLGQGGPESKDFEKIRRMYGCKNSNTTATSHSGCGGYFISDTGKFDSLNVPHMECELVIRPKTKGHAIKFSIDSMQLTPCSTNYIELYQGYDDKGQVLGKFCNENPMPGNTFIANTNSIYVKLVKSSETGGVTGNWESYLEKCCQRIRTTSSIVTGSVVSSTWAFSTNDVNNRPVYINEAKGGIFLSSVNPSLRYSSYWFIGHVAGDSSGYATGKDNVNCPQNVRSWYVPVQGRFAHEPEFRIECLDRCSAPPASSETGVTSDYDMNSGLKEVGSLVTYTCPNSETVILRCSAGGEWSPALVPLCPVVPIEPGVTTEATTEEVTMGPEETSEPEVTSEPLVPTNEQEIPQGIDKIECTG